MNVALVIGSLRHGGSERQLAYLANGLAAAGHTVRVVLLTTRHPDDYPLDAAVAVCELQINRWRGRLALPGRLRAECACADVVYSFLDLANALCALVKPRSSKLIWGWRASNQAQGALARIALWLCQRLRHRVDGVIANADAVLAHYRDLGLLGRNAHAAVVANGAGLQPQSTEHALPLRDGWREQLALPAAAEVLLVLGRYAAEKRHDLALDLVRQQAATYLVCAGRDVPRLQALWEHDPAWPRIRLLDHQGDVTPLLHGCDLLLSCSDHEGSPNVLVEALAHRVPVIATAVGGTPQLFARAADMDPKEDGQCRAVAGGWLVRRGDVAAMTAALDAWRESGATAVNRSLLPSVPTMVQQTEAVLERCAG